ncbi:MAG: tandem-95 repeat protein, partial [Planctomycetes bacterium]|nr:tandem-95 repeat protein [Planctomycetota bacterium]
MDSANVTATLTLSNPAAGSLNTATSGTVTSTYVAGTGVWNASGALADVNALLAGLTFTPAEDFNGNFTIATSISDGVAPAITGSKAVTGTPVNDAPTATNLNAPETYTEDTPQNLTNIVISDVDSANVTATLTLSNPSAGSLNTATSGTVTSTYVAGTGVWSASGALADVNALLAGLTFTPTENFTSNFTIATSVSDGVAPAVTGSKAMTGTAVNVAPTATNLSAPETYTEDTPLNLADIVVSDADSTNVTATLTLSNPSAGSLNTATSGTVTSTYVAGTGVWTASGALADVNALLAGLTFTPAENFNGNFSIATSVSDGVAPAITGSKTITGTPVNDAPTATNLNAAETYTEDTPLNLTNIVISDVDTANVTATLTLSNPSAGSLNTATSGTVTSTYVAGTGVWTASGALADVNSLLAGLTFTPTQDVNGNFTIATSVSDGVAPAVTGSKTMTGTAVNDSPTATNLSAAESYSPNTPLNLTDIAILDVDSTNVTATLTLSNPAAGSLNTATSGTVTSTYVAGTGVWTASGTLADVNTLLAGLTFTPATDFSSNFTIATSVS